MLQRKQTLFLIFIIALFTSMFFNDLVTRECLGLTPTEDKIYSISVSSLHSLGALAALIIVLSIATIALFKKASLQLRFAVFNIILIFGFIAVEIYSIYQFYRVIDNEVGSTKIGMATFLPLLALFFAFLAFRGIVKDILVLRSFNRMR